MRAQDEEQGQLEDIERQEARLKAAREDIDGKMRDLGALGDAVGALTGDSLAALRKKLAAATKEIERIGATVNQRAVEEFGDLTEEHKRLLARKEVRLRACVRGRCLRACMRRRCLRRSACCRGLCWTSAAVCRSLRGRRSPS